MEDEENARVGSRRRSRGADATARLEALQRLKALRSGGRRSESTGYQIKLENPIYDTVEEDEYDKLVAKRREEVKGFIVDDDGLLGYADDGEEEDWSKAGPHYSSEDEPDGERVKKKKAERKETAPKKPAPSSLTAAAALMGKQRLSSMFTSNVFKKSGGRDEKIKGLSCDSIVDDVIAEFAPDEADREQRRRAHGGGKSFASIGNDVKIEKESVGISLRPENGNENYEPMLHSGEAYLENVESGLIKGDIRIEEPRDVAKCEEPYTEPEDCTVEERIVDDKKLNLSEAKVEPTVKKEEVRTLNAKIVEMDLSLSATAGWKAVISGAEGNVGDVGSEVKQEMTGDERSDFELDADGSLPFYILDAYEEIFGANRGNIYMFGKVRAGNSYHSCCIVVKNMQRCVYAVPRGSMFDTYEAMKLEKDLEESQISPADFRAKLQDLASRVKTEVAKHLVDHHVSTFSMTPVKRKYAFERSDIPAGDNYVIKINYSFKDPPLPSDLEGETFAALLGTHCSALELLLVKRKIKGPSWLLISNFSSCHASLRVSWCKFEVTVDSPKDIKPASSSKHIVDIPPVIVTAINLKTIIKQGVNEIVSASIICCKRAKIDTPMLASEWKRPGTLSHFTVVRKLEGGIFPMGFTKEVTDKNMKAGLNIIGIESSERALLNRLMIELHKLDSDVIVGHNISGSDLDVLLHRAQACTVPSSMWSKIGRLKRSSMPKLQKGSASFASGASPGIMSCIAGRLLCDTFLCSRDLLKEVSYSLTQLAKSQLNKDRKEVAPEDIPKMFQSSESLMELIEFGETDAWLAMELMFHLSILPLTRQLTNISGNLWGKTMQGARAQRVEYLLLHNFHAKKYMVPDKRSSFSKDDEEPQNNEQVKGKKGPSYSGGLVLEPKRGLYDKYILLLDFNSLYPSIIQEYNICFTTVERSPDGTVPHLPCTQTTGVLPEAHDKKLDQLSMILGDGTVYVDFLGEDHNTRSWISKIQTCLLRDLVQRRRLVKSWMKKATGLKVQQFDIQQQALKLTANSMYGCLGFSKSRFYAKPLAEIITQQGREILQSTVDLVQNSLNLEVIYGDTDSIMIYSGLDDITKARAIAEKVIQEVNKKYRCLEIDLDGLYKRMLLLQKKKYAAVKLQFKDGKPYEVIERKGLDMVRRDWSIIAKELGDSCLSQILSGGSCEDIVESIHNTLMKVQEDVRNGQVELEKYIITKTLTKPPEAYPDAKNQPHVQVALRLKKNGYSTGCNAGDTIPYIICREQGVDVQVIGFAQRARHPDELKKDDGKWLIDIDYYLSEQIHRVVSRLCASIQGTSPERLADCLGLDSSKFQSKSIEAVSHDSSGSLFFAVDDEERYRDCKPLILSCPSCRSTFNCPVICSSVCKLIAEKSSTGQGDEEYIFWHKLECPKCPGEGGARLTPVMIANQVKRQVDGFISMYYKGLMMCDDETCKYVTRSLNLRVVGDSERGTVCPEYPRCNGHLVRQFSEADLYKQLAYFCYVLDTVHCLEKVDSKFRVPLEKELIKIRPIVDLASSTVQRIRDRCAYGWVRMNDLIIV